MGSQDRRSFSPDEILPCSHCGALQVIPVIFGEPDEEERKRAERDEVVLGGVAMPLIGVLGACIDCKRWRTMSECFD